MWLLKLHFWSALLKSLKIFAHEAWNEWKFLNTIRNFPPIGTYEKDKQTFIMNVRNVMKSVQESDLHIFWNCKATTQNRLMPSQTDSSKPKPDPCQRYACRIQDCLQKNNYQESKCVKFIKDLEECCKKFAGKSPTVCQGIRFDLPDTNGERRLWLQSRYKPYFQNFS